VTGERLVLECALPPALQSPVIRPWTDV